MNFEAADTTQRALVLAIDLGTSGLKVGLVGLDGTIVWYSERAVATEWIGDDGAEQDAEQWWRLIADATRDGLTHVNAQNVVAVAVTGQWASIVPVDDRGQPGGPCAMWQDRRGVRLVRQRIGGRVGGYDPRALATWVRHTGGIPAGNDPCGHILRLEADPPTAAAARWYLEPVDYLTMRFTGVAAASHASMTAAWLTDNRDLTTMRYDSTLIERMGIPATKLPPLHPTGSVIGPIDPTVAAELGLPPTAKVVSGVPDLHAAIIGSGATDEGQAHLALSTTSWISMPLAAKKTDVIHGMATIPGLFGQYALANNHDSSGLCLRWLRDNLLAPSDGLLARDEIDFAAMTELAETSPPGAGGVIFTPWLQGQRNPIGDANIRGAFLGLGLQSTQADLVRAVLEGVALNNAWLLDHVDKFAKRSTQSLRIVGGGAISALWCQIHADVTGVRIEQVADPMFAQLRGVALLAGVTLGRINRADIADRVPVQQRFDPNPENERIYARLRTEFPKIFKAHRTLGVR